MTARTRDIAAAALTLRQAGGLRPVAAALLALAGWACAANALAQSAPSPCPAAEQVSAADLVGLWRAEFPGHAGVTLLLEPNPRWEGSLAGELQRAGKRAEVSGDVADGEFTLEESEDGRSISGIWAGAITEGSCGREIRGAWSGPDDGPPRAFVLRRIGAW